MVRSGPVFGPQEASTETETGLHRFKDHKRPDRTDVNRSSAVLCSLLWLQDRSQPVTVETGLSLVWTGLLS